MVSRLLWTEKYKPRRLSDIVDQKKAIEEFRKWLVLRLQGRAEKKAALLAGPPGTGKTLTAEVAAMEFRLELIEMNASSLRTGSQLEKVAGRASLQGSLFGYRGKLILIDEVDGISTKADVGAIPELIKIIQKSAYPVVLTANNPWDPRFRPLREVCLMINYNRIGKRDIVRRLREICIAEGIKFDDEALGIIADYSQGDLRSAILDLQALTAGKKTLTVQDTRILAYRDREFNIFQILGRLFASRSVGAARAVVSSADVDPNMLFRWIEENLPLRYKDPKALAAAYYMLAQADIFFTRAALTQQWGLMSYALSLMTAGVAFAGGGKAGFIRFKFPEVIKMRSQAARDKTAEEVIAKLAGELHLSRRKFKSEFLPYLRIMASQNEEFLKKIGKAIKVEKSKVKKALELA